MRTSFKLSSLLPLAVGVIQFNAAAQNTNLPADYGTTVNGFQDSFNGTNISTNWVYMSGGGVSNGIYSESGGLLTATTAGGNPNHLVFVGGTPYNSTTQEVLLRIRIINLPVDTSANNLAGPAVAINTNFNVDSGVNWMLTGGEPTNYLTNLSGTTGAGFLYDYEAFGPSYSEAGDMPWQTNTWYWMRLNMNGFASGNGGATGNFSAKVWLADGSEAEPASWQVTWTHAAESGTNLAGYVGIKNGSDGEPCQFNVNYFLVKASGLPSITVSPSTNSISISQEPQSITVGPSQTATFTVAATASFTPAFQWQRAPAANPTNFVNVTNGTGGTTSNYATGPLTVANSGDQYQVIVSSGSYQLASTPATLTVDATPPALLWARTLGSANTVTLQFSEPVLIPANLSGFTFSNNAATVASVVAGPNSSVLVLATSTLSVATNYTLAVSGIQDPYANTLLSTNVTLNFAVYLPMEFALSVAGFQDSFTNSTMDPNWLAEGVDQEYVQSDLFLQDGDGLLHVSSPTNAFVSNPNRLLYSNAAYPYDSATQEVLLRLRVTAFALSGGGSGGLDSVGGATVGNNSAVEYGTGAGGTDWLLGYFNDTGGVFTGIPGFQAAFLNDWDAWGAGASYNWTTNTWYWLREFQNGTNTANGPNVFGKVWLADGTTPEPAAWQGAWYSTNRTGLAGIDAANYNGETPGPLFNFDVSYFLLKAAGLPAITVAPNSFTLVPPLSPLQFTSVQSSGTNVVLQWTGAGTLQRAASPAGPWADMVDPNGAFSPYAIPASSPAMFYRLRQ